MLEFFKNIFTKNVKNVSEIDLIIETIETLSPETFEYVHSSYMSLYPLMSYYKNIISYLRDVEYFTNMLDNDLAIPKSKLPKCTYEIKAKEFFLDDNGNYIDAVTTMVRYKKVMVTLLKLYDIRRKENKNNVKQNFDIIKLFISDIKSLSEDLHHVKG